MKKTIVQNSLVSARKKQLGALSDISYRLETIAEKNGVEYINDSKSTDMESTLYSLSSIKQPIIWILGASDTQQYLEIVSREVKLKVKNVISFGNYDKELSNQLTPITDSYIHFVTLESAVKKASELAITGDVVLFSPANSSFELYENYRERGNHFNQIVNSL